MRFLRKLPNSIREAPGLEWVVMKKLPSILLLGTLIPLAVSMANRLFPPQAAAAEIAKHIKSVDIMAIAIEVTVWTAVLTIAIGCFVVIVMKGHAYVADAYELSDAENPDSR